MGFGQGLSGLSAASQDLDIIGNNIANSGTVGFKAASAAFADVYAQSRVGLGVQVASVKQRFTVGNVNSTGNQYDIAIDGERGLFRVTDQSGRVLYTRNGQFDANKDNYIVNAQGYRLTGYAPGSTDLIPIMRPVGNIDPVATSRIENTVTFDADAAVVPNASVTEQVGVIELDDGTGATPYYYRLNGTSYTWYTDAAATTPGNIPADATTYTSGVPTTNVTFTGGVPGGTLPAGGANVAYVAPVTAIPFNPNNPDSFSNMTPVTVYDSLGNAHLVQQYFTKRPEAGGESVWEVNYLVDGQTPSTGGTTTYRFDQAGRLVGDNSSVITVAAPGANGSPALPLNVAISFAGSKQFGGGFNNNFTQNGNYTGEYASMSIGTDGSIIANYTNGATRTLGTLALADFNNMQGLKPVGGNAWEETAASGQAIMGTPGSNGLAMLKGQAVEASNVDMSTELVNMIIAQRTYQANAQTIKTQDQLLQTLITLR